MLEIIHYVINFELGRIKKHYFFTYVQYILESLSCSSYTIIISQMKPKDLQINRGVGFGGLEALQYEKNTHYVIIMPKLITAACGQQ